MVFTKKTATLQQSAPQTSPGAALQMLQLPKLQQTATFCNNFLHLHQSSNIAGNSPYLPKKL